MTPGPGPWPGVAMPEQKYPSREQVNKELNLFLTFGLDLLQHCLAAKLRAV